MSQPVHVLVCGGGIAGNAVGLQLLRAGITTTVVERAPAPRPGGQAVDLRGPSRRVAERMGLLAGIAVRQLDERGMVWVNDCGRQIVRVPAELFDGRGPVADIEITRGDLNEVLLDALAEVSSTSGELHYRYGDWVTEVDQDADGVAVTFASGAGERFDLVVGADGLHSAIRARVFGSEERFVEYLGGYVSFFTIPTPADTGVEPGWVAVHAMPGGSMLAVRPDRDPATSNAIVIMRVPAVAGLRGDVAAQQRLVRERLARRTWQVPAVLEAMADARDFYFDELARVRMPRWSAGRIVLLGDAGYCGSPLTGMGTAMALVGAYVLAGEIAAAPDDPALAFDRYEHLMRPVVTEAQKMVGIRWRNPNTRFGVLSLLAVVRLMTSRPLAPLRARLVKRIAKGEQAPVPEYPLGTAR